MWTRKLNIDQLNVVGKRILLRADYNVPMHDGKISNNRKIIAGLDSIVYALLREAKSVVIITHLGKPKGIKNMDYSLSPVAEELDKLLRQVQEDPESLGKYSQMFKQFRGSPKKPTVRFLSDCLGTEIEQALKDPPPATVFLLENLKFHVEEEYGLDVSGNVVYSTVEENKSFRQSLRKLGDIYVNDAFSLSHKTYSSILGDGFDKRAAGLILKKEMEYFRKALNKPKKPFLAILGGTKLSEKMHFIDYLLDKVNEIIIAGAVAFPFLKKLKHMQTGLSFFDSEGAQACIAIMKKAKRKRVNIHFPVDFLASSRQGNSIGIGTIKTGIEEDWMALDVGPETCSIFRRIIMRAKTIIWNGPPGAFELENFRTGTESVLLDIVKATSRGTTSIIVGHDTAACLEKWNQSENVSHITSGHTAAKEILEGKLLPGIAALSDYDEGDMKQESNEGYIVKK